MKRTLFLLLLALATAASLANAPQTHAQFAPPGINPTHWWTYRLLDPVVAPTTIFASDQFYRQGIPLTPDTLTRLVNWVRKNGSPVLPDTLLHYTWWNLPQKLPTPRAVHVANQFGQGPVNVTNLEFMLVPAWKNQPQPTQPVANHYLCYRANGFPPPNQPYSLFDEWRNDNQFPAQLEYLCNPCSKEHGQIYPAVDSLTHLALYRIFPHSDMFVPFIADQFFTGVRPVQQSSPEYLLVPSSKTELATPVRRSTWGRMKTIYR